MNYPVSTPMQLRAVIRALRQSRSLTQAQVGALLGVNQRRAARIEGNPGVTGFAQIARLISALGGRLVVTVDNESPEKQPNPDTAIRKSHKTRTAAASKSKSRPSSRSVGDEW